MGTYRDRGLDEEPPRRPPDESPLDGFTPEQRALLDAGKVYLHVVRGPKGDEVRLASMFSCRPAEVMEHLRELEIIEKMMPFGVITSSTWTGDRAELVIRATIPIDRLELRADMRVYEDRCLVWEVRSGAMDTSCGDIQLYPVHVAAAHGHERSTATGATDHPEDRREVRTLLHYRAHICFSRFIPSFAVRKVVRLAAKWTIARLQEHLDEEHAGAE